MRRTSPPTPIPSTRGLRRGKLVATLEVAVSLGGDAGRIVELAVSRVFGGGLQAAEHQSLEKGLGIEHYTGAPRARDADVECSSVALVGRNVLAYRLD